MKVKLHQPMKGKPAGKVVDLSDEDAKRMIAFGYAARVGGKTEEPKITRDKRDSEGEGPGEGSTQESSAESPTNEKSAKGKVAKGGE